MGARGTVRHRSVKKSRADRSPGSATEHTRPRTNTKYRPNTRPRTTEATRLPRRACGCRCGTQHMRAAHDTPTPSLTHQIAHDDHTRPPARSHKTANKRGRSRAHIPSLSLPVWPWSRHTSVTHTGATHMTAAHRGPPGQSPLHEPRHAVRWPGRCACPETARIWRPPRSLSLHAHDTTTLSHSCLTRLASWRFSCGHGPRKFSAASPIPRPARTSWRQEGRGVTCGTPMPALVGQVCVRRYACWVCKVRPPACHLVCNPHAAIAMVESYVYTMVSSPRSRRQVAEIASRSRGRRAA